MKQALLLLFLFYKWTLSLSRDRGQLIGEDGVLNSVANQLGGCLANIYFFLHLHGRRVIPCSADPRLCHVTLFTQWDLSRPDIIKRWCNLVCLLHFYHHHESNMLKPAPGDQKHDRHMEQTWTNLQLGATSWASPRPTGYLLFGETQVHEQEVTIVTVSHWILE